MTEKEAREIIESINQDVAYDRVTPTELRFYWSKGYLEAIEKAKVLYDLLNIGPHPSHGIEQGECWNCKRIEALAKWEKEK